MRKVKIVTADEAAKLINDNDTIAIDGFVQSSLPEALNKALEKRFLDTGKPEGLTVIWSAGQGNRLGAGPDHFAYPGMVKRVIAGHWNLAPKMGEAASKNEIEAYNLPQGVLCCLFREIAAKREGLISHVGLNTFADPRIEGGKLNTKTTEDLVEIIHINGKERLLYKTFPINVAFIRGTYADEAGNVTCEKEVAPLDSTSLAQAVKNSGGKVIVQVEKVVRAGTLNPHLVKIPGIYVTAVVVAQPCDHEQSLGCGYDPAISGEVTIPTGKAQSDTELSTKKIIARRAAMELKKNVVVNLGIGNAEYVSSVANEEGIGDYMTLTVECGPVGGIPLAGNRFGSSINPEALLDQSLQFDFYDGGGLDLAFLGLAQVDESGNVNLSKFGTRIAGCGGSIDISQNSKKVVYCGSFTAGGIKTKVENGKLIILQEGKERKFVKNVDQITFSGKYAAQEGQPVMYITERAVFELKSDGVYLTEVAPGIDIQTQILDVMDFVPKMENIKTMNENIFKAGLMELKNII
ncbi:acyl CoA:acetate/3-ketoacid CoA transferase [Anaerospora hongkongensis]|uniref:acyl CoA:acetate/3-ketoacid CoA transferase n=1 Tax=Anaerospora hongkongensis TaxID=244830 RepID=UPI00289AF2FF|nr:CoA-transferase [Anaerospora hongkongensis]